MTKAQTYVNFRWTVLVALVPLIVAGIFAATVKVGGLARYDSTFFTDTYRERYNTPGAVARALEPALQKDDEELLRELQGLRRPAKFETSPKMILVMLWEQGDRYFTYMYFDMDSMERHPHYVEEVKGRWVVAPADGHYYLHSGRWLTVWMPLAIVWWLVEAVVVLALWVHRMSSRVRSEMLGER